MSLTYEHHLIAAGLIFVAGMVMIPCFVQWLRPTRKQLESNFESIKERNDRDGSLN